MARNILVIKSTRRPQGNSSVMAELVAAGAKQTGAQVQNGVATTFGEAENHPNLLAKAVQAGQRMAE